MTMYSAHGHSRAYESHWPCRECALADLRDAADMDDDELAEQIYAATTVGLAWDHTEEDREELAIAIGEVLGIDPDDLDMPVYDVANNAWTL